MKRYVLLSVACAILCAASLPAAADAPKKITSVEGITEYQLDNGLRVLLFPDPSKATVTVNVTYFVGSRFEGYGETGMAHLLEHLVFKGTPTHPAIWKEMQDHGAQFNGTTSFDRTNYFETVTATEEQLDWALSLEADRMVNSHIAKKDLDSEFSVVRNEFEMGENSPLGVLQERIWSAAYLWHNYGKSTIGSREDIERVPIKNLKAFYQKYYQPDNAMLVVAGKFDEARTLERINKVFGAIPRPQRVLDPTYTVEPPQDGPREVFLRRVGDVQAVGAVYHICAGPHEDMVALEVLASIMDATQTGRLYQALVETQMATSVSASAEALHDAGLIEFDVETGVDKDIDEVRNVLVATVEGLSKQTITDEEVNRAKAAFAKRFEQFMSDSGRVGIVISNWAAMGDWRMMFLHRDRMAQVTPDDVKRVAATYLKPSNRTIGIFTPTKQPDRTTVPATPDLVALLKDYKGQKAASAGETIEPAPTALEARTTRGALKSGIKTALLPKKTRGGRVNIDLTLRYGDEHALRGYNEAAGLLGAMLERGTKKHTRRQLEDEFDRLNATVNVGGGGGGRRGRMMGGGEGPLGSLSVSIETVGENVPAVMELVNEMLREPAFPKSEFRKLKKQMLNRIQQGRSEPMVLGMTALRQKMSPYPEDDVRYVPGIDERIARLEAVELGQVKKLYKDFLNGRHGELVAVGQFEPADLTAAVEKICDGWTSRQPYERIAMPYQQVRPEQIVINTPDKKMAMVLMGSTMELEDDDPDYPAMVMANIILGMGGNSRLINRLRQKEGYSYGAGSMLSAQSEERAANFTIYAIAAPQNSKLCTAAAMEEVERFLNDGVTPKELEDAKKGYAEQVKVQLSNDRAIAGTLARQTYLDRTMAYSQNLIDKIQSLTVEEVNEAARKYLKAGALVCIQAGDLEKQVSSDTGATGTH